jgi:hypothetical protein
MNNFQPGYGSSLCKNLDPRQRMSNAICLLPTQ